MIAALLSLILSGLVAEVHNPRIPVIVDRPYNVVSEILIKAPEAAEVEGTVEVELAGLPRRAVRSVRLLYTGTSSALISRTESHQFRTQFNYWGGGWDLWHDPAYAEEIAKVRPSREGKLFLPLHGSLVGDQNYFYLSLEIDSRYVDMAAPFTCRIREIILKDTEGERALDLREDGPVLRRMGRSLRTHGDDGVDSYRIPCLVRTKKGTLLAAYDIRHDSSYDLNGDIDIGVSRSTDGGKTWERMRVAMDMGRYGGLPEGQNGIGDPCLLVDEESGDIFVAGIWAHGRHGGTAIFTSKEGLAPIDVAQMVIARSSDDGKTWSEPRNITQEVKDPAWATCFQGPGAGITMQDGTLVFPFQWWDADKVPSAGVLYSKDHGCSWHFDGSALSHVCEDQVVELEPGVLMLNMRNHGTPDRTRKVYVTRDLGKTWEPHPSNDVLPEPVCQASLLKIGAGENVLGRDVLLFLNPDSKKARNRMTLRISLDLGRTWSEGILLDEEAGWGYSCIAPIDSETVGVLYEGSTAQLVFQTVRLRDLISTR